MILVGKIINKPRMIGNQIKMSRLRYSEFRSQNSEYPNKTVDSAPVNV